MGRSISRRADDQQMGVTGPISAFIGVAVVTAAVMIGGSMEPSSSQPLVASDPVVTAVVPKPTTAPQLSADEIVDLLPVSTLVNAAHPDRVIASVQGDESLPTTAPTRAARNVQHPGKSGHKGSTAPGTSKPVKHTQPPASHGPAPVTEPTRPVKPSAPSTPVTSNKPDKAQKAQDKAQERAEREQRKAEEKAQKQAQREQDKIQREQEKAQREQEKAQRDQEKAQRDQEKAQKKTEREQRKAEHKAQKGH